MAQKPRDMPGDQPWLLPQKPMTDEQRKSFQDLLDRIDRINSAGRQKKVSDR
jgi:hypothetical protein